MESVAGKAGVLFHPNAISGEVWARHISWPAPNRAGYNCMNTGYTLLDDAQAAHLEWEGLIVATPLKLDDGCAVYVPAPRKTYSQVRSSLQAFEYRKKHGEPKYPKGKAAAAAFVAAATALGVDLP